MAEKVGASWADGEVADNPGFARTTIRRHDCWWGSFPFGLALILLIETSFAVSQDKFATNRLDCLEA
jgi:hypothetical protein